MVSDGRLDYSAMEPGEDSNTHERKFEQSVAQAAADAFSARREPNGSSAEQVNPFQPTQGSLDSVLDMPELHLETVDSHEPYVTQNYASSEPSLGAGSVEQQMSAGYPTSSDYPMVGTPADAGNYGINQQQAYEYYGNQTMHGNSAAVDNYQPSDGYPVVPNTDGSSTDSNAAAVPVTDPSQQIIESFPTYQQAAADVANMQVMPQTAASTTDIASNSASTPNYESIRNTKRGDARVPKARHTPVWSSKSPKDIKALRSRKRRLTIIWWILSILAVFFAWASFGLMMRIGFLPTFDLGYSWFDSRMFFFFGINA